MLVYLLNFYNVILNDSPSDLMYRETNFKELWAAMVIAIRTSSFIAVDTVRKRTFCI